MRRLCVRVATGLLLLVIAGGTAPAQTGAPPKPAAVRELQRALRDHDRTWLAEHIRYPMRYHGRSVAVIRNRSDFLRSYDRIVSDRLRSAVLMQDPDKAFENWQGVMVGDGTHNMWLRESGEGDAARYEIVTINDAN
jgi:hypothetical protein